MKEIIISGASDDLIEVDGAVREEFDVYNIPPEGVPIQLCVGERVLATVRAYYDGYWAFSFLGQVDGDGSERVVMPAGWRVEVRAIGDGEEVCEEDVAPYSMSLHIFMPDDCRVQVRCEVRA